MTDKPCCGDSPEAPIGKDDQTIEDWLACLDDLPAYVAHLPAGHIKPIYGDEIWVDAYGKHLTQEEFKLRHGVDPALAWEAIKQYRKTHGKGVRILKE